MRGSHAPGLQQLLHRLGLIPADTEFNRRAKAYAEGARNLANAHASNARKKARRNGNDQGRPQAAAVSGEAGGEA
jgi:hypothetical protein